MRGPISAMAFAFAAASAAHGNDNAVDFNIHYHDGPEAFYPVKRDGMRGDGGSFVAKIGQDYCWMWTARDKPVKLEGRIESK